MNRIWGAILVIFLMSLQAGCTAPLMLAVERNDIDSVKGLLDKGADINAKDKSCHWQTNLGTFSFECTALMHAAEMGRNEIIKVLLYKGADINMEIEGYTALKFAAENGHLETVTLLLERGATNVTGALAYAVYGGHTPIVKFLIDRGADVNVNARNHRDWPVLAEAAIMGHASIVKLLIEKGADVDAAATIFERRPNDADFKASLNLVEKYSQKPESSGVKSAAPVDKSSGPAPPPVPIVPKKELAKIAVWDLNSGDIKPAYAQDLTAILVSEISKSGKYEVYSQENVRTIAGWTAERMQLGCTDTKCLTALGQMDIAKLISGRVGKIGNRYSVSLNLFDTQNARAEKSVSEFGRSEDELIELLQLALGKLLGGQVSLGKVDKRPSLSAVSAIGRDGRFIAYNNGTVLDTRTNLMWPAKDNGSNIEWANAKFYCENYRAGGYTDWRMPTQDELAGLYDSSKGYRITQKDFYIRLTELIQLSGCCPWASETRGPDAASFDFGDGVRGWIHQSAGYNGRALPVRSGK